MSPTLGLVNSRNTLTMGFTHRYGNVAHFGAFNRTLFSLLERLWLPILLILTESTNW